MLALQLKLCLVVVECDVAPDSHLVTGGAVAAQPAVVRLDLAVTADALDRGLAEGRARRMTALTGRIEMRATQRVVGALVVELIAIELDDVSCAAEVLGMACAALGRLDPA